MFGSHGMGHTGFLQVDGGQRDPWDRGVTVSEGLRHGSGWVTFSSISCRHLSRDLHVLLECVCVEPLHVHLGGE